jgi:CRISPR-associated endonuclease/helicase Cas3
MPFFAHTENSNGSWHKLGDHLGDVGQRAAEFAAQMNPELIEAARWAGLLHDVGKYREEFQAYLRKERESSIETHHAVYGAALAFRRKWLAPALAISGHHTGLNNWAVLENDLRADLKYHAGDQLKSIIARFEAELFEIAAELKEPCFVRASPLSAECYVRMLFSALVDADFLDTEAHFQLLPRNAQCLCPGELLQRLIAEKKTMPRDGDLNALRNQIFQQCVDAARNQPGFFSLTVPTGGGKTLSSMAFALAHAERHGLRRVIVVIPYLSIIEQNAAQYGRILDPRNEGIVIEHHSAVAVPEDRNESRPRSPFLRHVSEYATENWDAPIVVTTSVQFIESLFANKTSVCRKLHNIASSVVILDEVQTLPSHLLNPLLNVLREMRDHYNMSFVFSTATQPAFRHRPRHLEEGFKDGEIREITRDTAETFRKLQRVKYTLPRASESLSWFGLAQQLVAHKKALCVVNIRRHAFELWQQVRSQVPNDERDSVFHLSSAMCAQHRFDILGDDREPQPRTIRYRLRNNLPCRLISTQLIEAGVDVDFPIVYRALGPLDSIVQAAGRCNREGKLIDKSGQPILGEVVVFYPENPSLPRGVYSTATDITASLLARTNPEELSQNHELFGVYFDQLCQLTETDRERIQDDRGELRFRDVAEKARVIPDDSLPVIVRYMKSLEIVDEIRSRRVQKGRRRFTRDDLRRLQRYMVNVRINQFRQLEANKLIDPLLPNLELHVLEEGIYHDHLGILLNGQPTEDLIL